MTPTEETLFVQLQSIGEPDEAKQKDVMRFGDSKESVSLVVVQTRGLGVNWLACCSREAMVGDTATQRSVNRPEDPEEGRRQIEKRAQSLG